MALMQQWPFALVAAIVALMVVVAAFLWPLDRRRRIQHSAVPLDHLDRLRKLPRYQQLVRSRLRRRLIQVVCVLVATACLVILVGRPAKPDEDWQQRRNHDVVLCLDVSGSMSDVDHDVIEAYRKLADSLDGNRIGLVAFNSAAVTIFPLTDDANYIDSQLTQFSRDLDRGPIPGSRAGTSGSSLIGDGLASCLQRFDGSDDRRGRTVVLATDNQLSGTPVFSLNEAIRQAVKRKVLIQAVAPSEADNTAVSVLHDAVAHTGGDVTLVTRTNLEDPDRIITAVRDQEARATAATARWTQVDVVWPFGVLALVCLVAATAMEADPRRRKEDS
ncbi:VWA domain-containing protein [Cutibacterium sp. WCA-380-WT-3A]|uniref:VWA domain-containing protein n=1 Tax=Cutibacterium porci TaxID=2605781 RepID=A0A7K0J801_9ACTN|nr:vWA domain-containing protein [Cutibacterium porci]MSS46087.1 VWA domain-containing protein [Cutibacterium porci]